MYRKEVNERSPMRVFEKSIHGGLGRGNVGVVLSRAGVGKTALLVQIALDDLLRDRRVLHISTEHAVDHVRAYYDELFHDLAQYTKLAEPESVRLDVERHRLIFSLLGHAPTSEGTSTSLKKLIDTVAFARDVAHFSPDVIVIDGFDFAHASEAMIDTLATLARDHSAELWLSTTTKTAQVEPGVAPAPIDRFFDKLGVVVYLESEKDVVRLRLLKDTTTRIWPRSPCVSIRTRCASSTKTCSRRPSVVAMPSVSDCTPVVPKVPKQPSVLARNVGVWPSTTIRSRGTRSANVNAAC